MTEAVPVKGAPAVAVKDQADRGRGAKPGVAQEARVRARGAARGKVQGALPREGDAPLHREVTGDPSHLVKVEVESRHHPQRGVEGAEATALNAPNQTVLNEKTVRRDNGAAARSRAVRECACA